MTVQIEVREETATRLQAVAASLKLSLDGYLTKVAALARVAELVGTATDDAVAQAYQLRDHATVMAFLRKHSYLADTLLPALPRVRQYFDESTQVALEVVYDPEDGDRKLFAYILTALSVEQALAKLDQFFDGWWLDACEQTQGELIFTVDFI